MRRHAAAVCEHASARRGVCQARPHRAAAQSTASERLVSPYFLEPNPAGHTRYLIGHDALSGEVRTFRVERIQQAELTGEQSQRAEVNADGTTDMLFDVSGLLEITPWILSWGNSVEAVEPPELRQRVGEVVCATSARYYFSKERVC